MINRTILVGRLTRDPDFKTSQSGTSVANFTLAVNRQYSNAQGEREADFIKCVTFKKQAENVNTYLSKGSLVGVDGRLQSRSYDNKEGQRVFVTELICDSVQFLEPKSQNQQSNQQYQQQPNQQYQQQNAPVQNPFANMQQQQQQQPAFQQQNNQQYQQNNNQGVTPVNDNELPF